MPKFCVTIKATVTKTLEVEADNAAEAEEIANSDFTTEPDGTEERYDQEVLRVQAEE